MNLISQYLFGDIKFLLNKKITNKEKNKRRNRLILLIDFDVQF